MLILSFDSTNNSPDSIPADISVQFLYNEKANEEIHYIRAICFENWCSNVGGFVDMLFGYSMMQLPEWLLLLSVFLIQKVEIIGYVLYYLYNIVQSLTL